MRLDEPDRVILGGARIVAELDRGEILEMRPDRKM